jgi:hypothetical protein
MYKLSQGTAKNLEKVSEYYKKAANQEHSQAKI